MRDGFKSIEIEPTETSLDFIGPAKPEQSPACTLKGQVRFSLAKQTKIRAMSIKFKGVSENNIEAPTNISITTPLLPKLKVSLFGRITLPAGEQVIPWEIDIPNIYPRTLNIKRSKIYYKVTVSVSVGIARTITAECPITIRRHLLPYKELSPFIETKLYQRTIPSKFHYEIDAPQIVCAEQKHIPMAIKYVTFANQKPVKAIRTRLIQIEHYRRQPLSKSDSDLSFCNPDSLVFDLSQKLSDAFSQKDNYIKYAKKTEPALIHTPDNSANFWKRPCLIHHRLHPSLSYTLNSPLVSVYHQLEITFQFGMKFEEIKANIPIIIASVPITSSNINKNEAMMKYPFEESSKIGFLPCQMDSHPNKNESKDTYSAYIDQDEQIELDLEMLSAELIRPGQQMHTATIHNLPKRRALSPLPENPDYFDTRGKSLRKFASAYDLSTESQSSIPIVHVEEEERPRTTTPTRNRRDPIYRKKPRPIDVELANQFDRIIKQTFPPRKDPPKNPPPPPPRIQESTEHSSSSGVLPVIDRSIMKSQSSAYVPSGDERRKNRMWLLDKDLEESTEDLGSLYSENSVTSKNAPSLSSSATVSTSKSHQTLHSRPQSPVFSPAPGLPATIPLRPQEYSASQVEELFPDSDINMSPTMTTVASSAVLSPRSSYSHHQRIALSTISSLTNDSFYIGSAIYSRARSSSTVDPETHSWLGSSDSNDSGAPSAPIRYLHAKLPPIPNSRDPNKRLTKLYLEDSDDEMDQPPTIPSISELRNGPPILPRLSFGKDFSISLGLD